MVCSKENNESSRIDTMSVLTKRDTGIKSDRNVLEYWGLTKDTAAEYNESICIIESAMHSYLYLNST